VDCWAAAYREGQEAARCPSAGGADRPERQDHLPLLGIFGNEDKNRTSRRSTRSSRRSSAGKAYEFHRYDGVGHAFFNTWREGYRAPQALDGWEKVFGLPEASAA